MAVIASYKRWKDIEKLRKLYEKAFKRLCSDPQAKSNFGRTLLHKFVRIH